MATSLCQPIRVVIVDDHGVVRAGLRMLIESRPGLTVVGEAGNGSEALAVVAHTQPDIIVLDLDLGGENGLDHFPELRAAASAARVLVLTGVRDPELHRQAVRLGAMGLVLKEKAADMLLQAIEKVHAGEVWLESTMVADVLGALTGTRASQPPDPEAARIAALTEREREIVTLIGQGLRNKQIAERLGISETTVRHHLTSIFAKLEVSDRLELVIYAYRHSLAGPPR